MPRSRKEERNVIKSVFPQVEKMAWPKTGEEGNDVFLEQKVDQCVYMCVCVHQCVCTSLFEFIDDDGKKPQSVNLEISEDQIT